MSTYLFAMTVFTYSGRSVAYPKPTLLLIRMQASSCELLYVYVPCLACSKCSRRIWHLINTESYGRMMVRMGDIPVTIETGDCKHQI